MNSLISKISVTKTKKINMPNGSLFHGLKKTDFGFKNFGEVYFSFIKFNNIKAWKKHQLMTLNLLVPIGSVKFVFYDDLKNFKSYKIGQKNYCRLTVPPGIWFGFKGLSKEDSLIINIANILHSDNEVEKKEINEIDYDWNKY